MYHIWLRIVLTTLILLFLHSLVDKVQVAILPGEHIRWFDLLVLLTYKVVMCVTLHLPFFKLLILIFLHHSILLQLLVFIWEWLRVVLSLLLVKFQKFCFFFVGVSVYFNTAQFNSFLLIAATIVVGSLPGIFSLLHLYNPLLLLLLLNMLLECFQTELWIGVSGVFLSNGYLALGVIEQVFSHAHHLSGGAVLSLHCHFEWMHYTVTVLQDLSAIFKRLLGLLYYSEELRYCLVSFIWSIDNEPPLFLHLLLCNYFIEGESRLGHFRGTNTTVDVLIVCFIIVKFIVIILFILYKTI